jgi:hypothetical protein
MRLTLRCLTATHFNSVQTRNLDPCMPILFLPVLYQMGKKKVISKYLLPPGQNPGVIPNTLCSLSLLPTIPSHQKNLAVLFMSAFSMLVKCTTTGFFM